MFLAKGRSYVYASIVIASSSLAAYVCGCSGSATTSNLGTITTVAGTGKIGNSGNGGLAKSAQLYQPSCVALDTAGNLYIGDLASNTIRKVTAATGVISLYAGNGKASYSGDGGPATAASMYAPTACALDSAGNLYVADDANSVIRKISASTGIITTVAGNGVNAGTSGGAFNGDGGLATNAELNHPFGVAVDSSGNLFISDTSNQRVRKVDAETGIITTVAGNGTYGYSGSGKATEVMLGNPENLVLDGSGNLYIAEQGSCVIAKLALTAGTITTVAGTGKCGSSVVLGDGGSALKAILTGPDGIALDGAGNLFISDTGSSRVREVDAAHGVIFTVVGSKQGFAGDGGPSNHAKLSNPYGLSFDSEGNLYIADSGNGAIRKVKR